MVESAWVVFGLTMTLGYVYAFVGGFTDAANAIATSVGTRALSPTQAVLAAAVFEVLGALTGTAVALTIGTGLIDPKYLNQEVIAAALLGAMAWSLLTYYRGLPVSETHGLIGGIVGVALYSAGAQAIQWATLLKVLAAVFVSPILGFGGAVLVLSLVYHGFQRLERRRSGPLFRNLQRLSAMFMAFSHGRNDAQKPMGIVAMALAVQFRWEELRVPVWVIVSVGLVAGFGVAVGGWRIIRTLGMRLTGLEPEQGFAAEASAATVLQLASMFGVPVSTTHAISSAVVGAGTVRGRRKVRWDIAFEIAISWLLTLPVTITLGYGFALLLDTLF